MEALTEYLHSQAGWRAEKADEYPDDLRNEQCCRALYSLIEYIKTGELDSTGIVDRIEMHGDEESLAGGKAVDMMVSRYGFGYEATTPSQHEEFLGDMWVACMQDAYAMAFEHADSDDYDDYSSSLLPCEIDAARAGVWELPDRYWELRPSRTEPELEAEVAAHRALMTEDDEDVCSRCGEPLDHEAEDDPDSDPDESVDVYLGVHDRCVTVDELDQRLAMIGKWLKQPKAD